MCASHWIPTSWLMRKGSAIVPGNWLLLTLYACFRLGLESSVILHTSCQVSKSSRNFPLRGHDGRVQYSVRGFQLLPGRLGAPVVFPLCPQAVERQCPYCGVAARLARSQRNWGFGLCFCICETSRGTAGITNACTLSRTRFAVALQAYFIQVLFCVSSLRLPVKMVSLL